MNIQSHDFRKNSPNIPFPLPNDDRAEAEDNFGFDQPDSPHSEDDNSESLSDVGDDSDDMIETPVMSFMNDIGIVGDDDVAEPEYNNHIDVWKESRKQNKVRNAV
ncbi:hypothetical protein LXL04_003370 [Taraxacum kok-saghyz]